MAGYCYFASFRTCNNIPALYAIHFKGVLNSGEAPLSRANAIEISDIKKYLLRIVGENFLFIGAFPSVEILLDKGADVDLTPLVWLKLT